LPPSGTLAGRHFSAIVFLMDDRSVQFMVLMLAVATPLLAAVLHVNARAGRMSPLRPGRLPLLALAGPLNALAWFVLQGRLQGSSGRTAFGIALAALVFIGLGFGVGWLRRPKDQDAAAGEPRGHGKL
jgi:hypothetical protein